MPTEVKEPEVKSLIDQARIDKDAKEAEAKKPELISPGIDESVMVFRRGAATSEGGRQVGFTEDEVLEVEKRLQDRKPESESPTLGTASDPFVNKEVVKQPEVKQTPAPAKK